MCDVLSFSVVSESLQPHGLELTRLLCPWDFPGKNTGVDCHFLLQDLPNPGIETVSLTSPTLAGEFFTTVPPKKPKSTYNLTKLKKKKRKEVLAELSGNTKFCQ